MVPTEFILTIIFTGGISGLIGALVAAYTARRTQRREDLRQRSEANKARDEIETKFISEAANAVSTAAKTATTIANDQMIVIKGQLDSARAEMQQRLAQAEARLASAEGRVADSEARANRIRSELVILGQGIQRERKEYQDVIDKLVVIIRSLASRMREAGIDPNVDLDSLDKLTDWHHDLSDQAAF